MNHHNYSFVLPIPCGTWFATRVSVSALLPLLLVVLCWKLGLQLGLVLGVIFFVSILVHEFAHVVAARMTGGAADEILMWPFGGLAFTQPADTFQSRFMTSAAGPLVNLILCAVTLKAVLDSGLHRAAAFHPLLVPDVAFSDNLLSDLLILVFAANWVLLLINLLPVFPLDGGQMLRTVLTARWGNQTGVVAYIRIGFVVGLIGMFVGLLLTEGGSAVVFLGAVILLMNMYEMFQMQTGEAYDESFMGYDFSQGYTSLEKSAGAKPERRPGFFEQWKERRRQEKLRRKREQDAQIELQLDEVLDKVHRDGIESLTSAEKRLLDRASNQFRERQSDAE